MRPLLLLLPALLLSACERVGKNPWAHLDYAEMNCGTKEAILTTTGCITAAKPVAAPTVTATARPIRSPHNVGEDKGLDDTAYQQQVNTSTIHDNNANTTIHGTNADNTVHGIDTSNNVHGNNTTDSLHAGPANNDTTTTVLGYNGSNYGPTTAAYGNNTNVGSVYGNAPGAAVGQSTGSGVEGPVTGVYGDNNSTGADHK